MKRPKRIVSLAHSVHQRVQIRLAFETHWFKYEWTSPELSIYTECCGSECAINMAKYLKYNLEGRFVQIFIYACDYNSFRWRKMSCQSCFKDLCYAVGKINVLRCEWRPAEQVCSSHSSYIFDEGGDRFEFWHRLRYFVAPQFLRAAAALVQGNSCIRKTKY